MVKIFFACGALNKMVKIFFACGALNKMVEHFRTHLRHTSGTRHDIRILTGSRGYKAAPWGGGREYSNQSQRICANIVKTRLKITCRSNLSKIMRSALPAGWIWVLGF